MTCRATSSFSTVICTKDRPEALERCLGSLQSLDPAPLEIIVVDNGTGGGSSADAARRFGARYVREPVAGLSRARNRGVLASRGDFVAFIDDDAVAESDWIAALAVEFEDPAVMAVAGRILYPDRSLGRDRRKVLDRRSSAWFEQANFGGIGSGANMAFRRCAFGTWPGFDPRLGLGGMIPAAEEHYAFFSLIDRGFRVAYAPNAVVRHPTPRSGWRVRVASAAYFAFLFANETRHRGAVVRYVWEAIQGVRRTWRIETPEVQ